MGEVSVFEWRNEGVWCEWEEECVCNVIGAGRRNAFIHLVTLPVVVEEAINT